LIRGFPVLMDTLTILPFGLPNLHVAVISSDMGAGDGSIASCDSTGGKNGIFQYAPRGTCTDTTLTGGATFISRVNGVANFTAPNISDVFTCIAALGEQGCGFEHQLASVTRALGIDGAPAPAENQGFLRPDALLAVIVVTNEDDCSAAPGTGPNGRIALFDTGSNTDMASQLGPPANFRCNEFGHKCTRGGGAAMRPDRNAPNLDLNQMVTYDTCASNDSDGYLLSVSQVAQQLKAIKNDPDRLLVAVIAGPKTPYTVTWKAPSSADTSCNTTGQTCPWPVIAHSCTAADTSFADPAVRLSAWAQAFGNDGFLLSICDDFGPSMRKVGEEIGQRLGLPVDGGIDEGGARDGSSGTAGAGGSGGGGAGGGGAGGGGAGGGGAGGGGAGGGGAGGGGGGSGGGGAGGSAGAGGTGAGGRGGTTGGAG